MKRVGILADHVSQRRVIAQFISLLDEIRQVPELAVLHNQVYMSIRFAAVDQGDDVRVMKAFEDLDLAVEVVFEFTVEFAEVDRLDCYKGTGCLRAGRLANCTLESSRVMTEVHLGKSRRDRTVKYQLGQDNGDVPCAFLDRQWQSCPCQYLPRQ